MKVEIFKYKYKNQVGRYAYIGKLGEKHKIALRLYSFSFSCEMIWHYSWLTRTFYIQKKQKSASYENV
jgi:hypothetical protein